MPDVILRDELERKLGRELGKLQQDQMARLLEYMGDPPQLERVPPEFWNTIGEELLGVLRPFLSKLYLDQAAEFLGSQSIGVDWALINTQAVNWAGQYSFDLVKGITDNTRTALQSAVSGYYQTAGQTIGELQDKIAPLFGPVRAESISVTEITRASVQGEQGIVDQIMADNSSLEDDPEWSTNNDDRVCAICGPRNGKRLSSGVWTTPPPAHIRCRCRLNHKFKVRHA
jgi:hypothetical protein